MKTTKNMNEFYREQNIMQMRVFLGKSRVLCFFIIVAMVSSIFYSTVNAGNMVSLEEQSVPSGNTWINAEYVEYCKEIGEKYCVSPYLLIAMIERESGGNPDAINLEGDSGLMQVSPKWHTDRMVRLGVGNLFDPYENILVGTDYIVELAQQYDDISMVLMCYNGTPESEAFERNAAGEFTEYASWIMQRAVVLERMNEEK